MKFVIALERIGDLLLSFGNRAIEVSARIQLLDAKELTLMASRLEKMLGTVSQGRQTLQSMVFEPSNRVVYLSAGADAAHGRFRRLDLRPYLER